MGMGVRMGMSRGKGMSASMGMSRGNVNVMSRRTIGRYSGPTVIRNGTCLVGANIVQG